MRKYFKFLTSFASFLMLLSCTAKNEVFEPNALASDNAEFDLPLSKSAIRTPDGANALDLETET